MLEKIKTAKDVGDDDLRNELLEKGEQLLIERNKHICIAEKYGWDTVECYTTDPIASDSDDEKKIKKVVKECKLLREEKRKAKLLKSKRPMPLQRGVERSVILKKPPLSSMAGKVPTASVTRDSRTCFRCFRPGHVARDCRAATTNNGSGQSHSSGPASSS